MSQVKARGNRSTELKLIKIFRENGLTGWRRNYPLTGSPDFVFPKPRLAIFVDGCFWHGCQKHYRMPKSNQEYWEAKIQRNKKRDRAVMRKLREKNWITIRIWEHSLKNNRCARQINRIKKLIVTS